MKPVFFSAMFAGMVISMDLAQSSETPSSTNVEATNSFGSISIPSTDIFQEIAKYDSSDSSDEVKGRAALRIAQYLGAKPCSKSGDFYTCIQYYLAALHLGQKDAIEKLQQSIEAKHASDRGYAISDLWHYQSWAEAKAPLTPEDAINLKALQSEFRPVADQPWVNSQGIKFVTAGTDGVLFSIWDVRVKDYQVFVTETGHDWPKPSFTQTENDPAVNVSWYDAQDYCEWLTKKERSTGILVSNQKYRLPTDVEWSKAVGLDESSEGTPKDRDEKINGVYPWGNQWPPPSRAGNYLESLTHDSYVNTSPVGSFNANRYGLFDMGGNVWQWCEDWYDNARYQHRVLRGASWDLNEPDFLLSSYRNHDGPDIRRDYDGFRVVVVVSP